MVGVGDEKKETTIGIGQHGGAIQKTGTETRTERHDEATATLRDI